MLSKPLTPAVSDEAYAGVPPGGDLNAYPTLCDHLCQVRWPDGSARDPGTILVCFGDGLWKACLIDKDGDRTLWTSCEHLGGLLQNLEDTAASPRASWRRRRDPPKAVRGR